MTELKCQRSEVWQRFCSGQCLSRRPWSNPVTVAVVVKCFFANFDVYQKMTDLDTKMSDQSVYQHFLGYFFRLVFPLPKLPFLYFTSGGKTIYVKIFDSGGTPSYTSNVKSTFKKFLNVSFIYYLNQHYGPFQIGIENNTEWMASKFQFVSMPTVLQSDSSSCGVFTILNALKATQMISFNLSSDKHFIDAMRTCLAAEIASKQLILCDFLRQ